jgi:diacylglycerol O-acyltransferase / wax synthase
VAAHEGPPAASESLSYEDLAILRLESETVAGHTLKVAILDPPPHEPRPDVEALRARIAARIERAPRLRCRLQMRSKRRAAWVDDPGFDGRDHVRAIPVSGTLSDDDLRRIYARMMEERLDRSRQLWTIDVLDPLEKGDLALVWRLHHSLADGAMAMRLAEEVLWDSRDLASPGDVGGAQLTPLADLRKALEARRPERLPGTLRRELSRTRDSSPFNGVVGTRRTVAFSSIQLGGLKRAAKALVPGATVNDVVLALVGGGLRSWAEFRGAALGRWRVKIPVSLHHHAENPETANRHSFFYVGLPLAEPDPVERLRHINAETTLRKGAGDALVLDTLLRDVSRVAPPLRHLLDRLTLHPRAFALNVSNVIGPRNRPSVLGAPVRAFYSIADVDYRHGLRVAVISMADELHFGLCAEPAIVGNLDPLVEGILAEAASLTGRSPADSPGPAKSRSGPVRR